MAKKKSKAKIVRELHDAGIPVDADLTVKELEHRLEHWKSPNGWLLRRFRPVPNNYMHPAMMLNINETTWVPDSEFAEIIVSSKKVMIVGRSFKAPKGVAVLDVPKDLDFYGSPGEEE